MFSSGWKANLKFEWLERVFPTRMKNELQPCAMHCARNGAERIGECVPRGMVWNYTSGGESLLSDRGVPFCGSGKCCRTPDKEHLGDPGCDYQGCVGTHCCWDTSQYSSQLGQTSAANFRHQGLGASCFVRAPYFPTQNFEHLPKRAPPPPPQASSSSPARNISSSANNITDEVEDVVDDPSSTGLLIIRDAIDGVIPSSHQCQVVKQPIMRWEKGADAATYRTYVDEKLGYWKVKSGQEPFVSWEIHEQFQSSTYKLALVWKDIAQTKERSRFMSTLTFKGTEPVDDTDTNGAKIDPGTIVNWLLYDIDSSATNTLEARTGELQCQQGANSWNLTSTIGSSATQQIDSTWMGPCTYPLGYPVFGKSSRYEVELIIYEARFSRQFAKPVTLGNFYKAVKQNEVVGSCAFYPVSNVTYRKDTPDSTKYPKMANPVRRPGDPMDSDGSEYGGPFTLVSNGVAIEQADGNHGTEDVSGGRNSTEPCGAYGCICKYSMGNC